MELADLTRGMRKKLFFRALNMFFFCKAGLVTEFRKGSAKKNN